jgi:hypothetical protein
LQIADWRLQIVERGKATARRRATLIRAGLCVGFVALVAAVLAVPGAGRRDRAAPARTVSDPVKIRELEDVVSKAQAKGLIRRLDADRHQVDVDPILWAYFDADTKRGFALSLAAYCDLKSSEQGRYVDVIDSRTGRKIASYGAAGFEIVP